jgi:C1A family cysteine protease
MADKQGIPLNSIEGFSEEAANQLASLWITTAEDLVSTARQEDGLFGLADYLDQSDEATEELVGLAVAALPPGVDFAPDDIIEVSLGAMDDQPGPPPEDEPAAFAAIPASVNLIAAMAPIRDQKNRGTCVAHACVAVREYLLGEQGKSSDLSEQYLYWACKERDGYNGAGTWIRVAMEVLKDTGVCVENIWPYHPDEVAGNEGQGPPPAGATEEAGSFRIKNSKNLQSRWANAIRETLADGRPVAFAVPVYRYWLTEPVRSTGDIRMPLSVDASLGGHAMAIVGYEDDPAVPGGGFFLVRNSWGTDWAGQSAVGAGYCRLPYQYISDYGRSAYAARAR